MIKKMVGTTVIARVFQREGLLGVHRLEKVKKLSFQSIVAKLVQRVRLVVIPVFQRKKHATLELDVHAMDKYLRRQL